MSAVINGIEWSADFTVQATVLDGHGADLSTMQIAGTDTSAIGAAQASEVVITLAATDRPAVGTYPLDLASIGRTPGYNGNAQLLQGGAVWSSWTSNLAGNGGGSLVVTTLTSTRIAGTFAFIAVRTQPASVPGAGVVEVKDGKFDIRLRKAGGQ
jgi:hypothetical protein